MILQQPAFEVVPAAEISTQPDALCRLRTTSGSERQCAIEERIFTAKPVTRADMTRKLALYDYYKDHIPENGASIIRDLRRLFQTQTTLAA